MATVKTRNTNLKILLRLLEIDIKKVSFIFIVFLPKEMIIIFCLEIYQISLHTFYFSSYNIYIFYLSHYMQNVLTDNQKF